MALLAFFGERIASKIVQKPRKASTATQHFGYYLAHRNQHKKVLCLLLYSLEMMMFITQTGWVKSSYRNRNATQTER